MESLRHPTWKEQPLRAFLSSGSLLADNNQHLHLHLRCWLLKLRSPRSLLVVPLQRFFSVAHSSLQ